MYPVNYPVGMQASQGFYEQTTDALLTSVEAIRPTYSNYYQRRLSIVFNRPAVFNIADHYSYSPPEPVIRQQDINNYYNGVIESAAKLHAVDRYLIKSIFLMETSNVYSSWIDPLRQYQLPMNIQYQDWKELAGSKEYIQVPINNIEVGSLILKRIIDKLKDPSIAKIASIFHQLDARIVNEYGAKVAMLYCRIKGT